MNTHVKRAIIDHAHASPAQEVCGFVYQDDAGVHAYPCANVSVDKVDSFEIDPADYIAARQLGIVCAIYHGGLTHTNDAFSEEDLAMAREMCLPFHLYAASGAWSTYIPPTYHVELAGRIWAWGEADCYSVVRDHYRQKLGIYLPDYDRDASFERATESIIVQHVADGGFAYVDRSAPILCDDVLVFRTAGSVYPQHLAVYLGGNVMLHHPRNQLSRTEPLDGVWLRRLTGVLRYVGQP